MKKRLMSIALIAVLLMGLLAGCAKKEEKKDEAKAGFTPALDTQQTAGFSIVGHLSNFEALEAVITEFTKYYPNVTIAYEKMGDYNNMLPTRLENDPNVGCFLDGPHEYCVDLAEYNYDTSAFSFVLNSGKHEGKLLAVPLGIDVRGLVVNATLLEKEGLKVPENYAEFVSVCDALVAKGYTPIQQKNAATSRNIFQNLLWNVIDEAEDTDALVAKLSSGAKGSFECMRPLFDMLESFVKKGYIDPEKNNALKDDYEAAILNFFQGDVPFMPANSDTVSGMAKREVKSEAFTANPFTYKFIYVPLNENGVYAEQRAWRLLSVNKNCANKDLAIEFLRFVGTKESLNLLAEVKGIPSASCEPADPRFANINDAKGKYIHAWDYEVPGVVWNSVIGRMAEYLSGDIATIDETLAIIEEDVVR